MTGTARPAFYALAPGGWRDYVTLLHPPYTLWHLSYVVIGAGLAPHFKGDVLGFALGHIEVSLNTFGIGQSFPPDQETKLLSTLSERAIKATSHS